MIKEAYVSFEVAKLLKDKGFDIPCSSYYEYFSSTITMYQGYVPEFTDSNSNHNGSGDKDIFSRPTQQMAMAWLREVHNICITIYPDKEKGFESILYDIESNVEITLQSFGIYGSHIFENSYEEVVEVALKYALENLI